MTRRGTTIFPAIVMVLVLAGLAVLVLRSITCSPTHTLGGTVTYDLKHLHEVVEQYANDHNGRGPYRWTNSFARELEVGPI
jgi:hypothetical protein